MSRVPGQALACAVVRVLRKAVRWASARGSQASTVATKARSWPTATPARRRYRD
eukprot:COSAG05_NODE_12298_length_473_cov_1.240642_1_plen_53_part_10